MSNTHIRLGSVRIDLSDSEPIKLASDLLEAFAREQALARVVSVPLACLTPCYVKAEGFQYEDDTDPKKTDR